MWKNVLKKTAHCAKTAESISMHMKNGVCLFQYAGGIKESMYRFKYKIAREYGAYYGWETAKRYGNYLNMGN